MLDPKFDPLKILEQISDNQTVLNQNQHRHAEAIRQLMDRVNQQQTIIDDLVENLKTTNQANEILLRGLVADINKNFTSQGQH
jgi:hypothetical protein